MTGFLKNMPPTTAATIGALNAAMFVVAIVIGDVWVQGLALLALGTAAIAFLLSVPTAPSSGATGGGTPAAIQPPNTGPAPATSGGAATRQPVAGATPASDDPMRQKLVVVAVQIGVVLYLLLVPVQYQPWLILPLIAAGALLGATSILKSSLGWMPLAVIIIITALFPLSRCAAEHTERAEEHARAEAVRATERAAEREARAAAARAQEAAARERESRERELLGKEWRIAGQEWPVFVDSLEFDERGALEAFTLEYSLPPRDGATQSVRWQCRRTEGGDHPRFDCRLYQRWQGRSVRMDAVLYRTASDEFSGRYEFRHEWREVRFLTKAP